MFAVWVPRLNTLLRAAAGSALVQQVCNRAVGNVAGPYECVRKCQQPAENTSCTGPAQAGALCEDALTAVRKGGRAFPALARVLTISNGVGEGHHDNGQESWNSVAGAAPGDACHVHHHERAHHQQGRADSIGRNACCAHTQSHSDTMLP